MYDNQTINSVITDEIIWRSDISGVDRKGRIHNPLHSLPLVYVCEETAEFLN
jgi:hypothetical protein